MKKLLVIFIVFTFSSIVFAQEEQKELVGTVEYISSQFTYVNFNNTTGIKIGDTLFTKTRNKLIPKLIVTSLSSRSCAAKVLSQKIKKGTPVIAIIAVPNKNNVKVVEEINKEIIPQDEEVKPKYKSNYNRLPKKRDKFYGRLSVSGYSNLSNNNSQTNYQNWRYSLSMNADQINNSKFSFSSYVTFRYRADEWSYVKSNIGDALKIYNLAMDYDVTPTTIVTLGRKINRKVTNIGAIDGLQIESRINGFTVGAVAGTRPDFNDYRFNVNLLQMGGYVNRVDSIGKSSIHNTISLFQQMNDFTTDRRFFYLQHSNNIIPNLNVFMSTEIDLFKKKNGQNLTEANLTSIYFSARYSPVRWITASASYDARKNVIYYETFKNYADRLIEDALRQGFRFRVNLRPIRYVFFSIYSGYRFRDADIEPSRNFGASVTHSRIPYLNLSTNVSFIKLNTSYINGNIVGLRFNKDFFNGVVYGTFGYRRIDYSFTNSNSDLLQNIFMIDLSTRLSRTISFSISFEGTYEKNTSYSNIYANFTTRF